MFSIVIPLYNKEKEIKNTIQSVLNQTLSNFEIIVVDDGSTDNSAKVVEEILDNRIKLYKKTNGGESSARNLGISHSEFEYIAFLDADDFWEESFLEKMSYLIMELPRCGMYSSLYRYKIGNDYIIPNFPKFGTKKSTILITDYFKYSQKAPIITSSNAIIPKFIFNEVGGFNEDIKHGPDLEMWIKIAIKYHLGVYIEYLAVYFLSANNRVCFSTPSYYKSIASVLHKFENANLSIYTRKYYNKIRVDFLSQFLHSDNRTDFLLTQQELKVYDLKSFILKYFSFHFLRLIIKK